MVKKNVLGIIFSHYHGEGIKELTANRAVASIPFGCRYRLIDFTLSNMVNAGIDQVGVVTETNYRSLMNHLGSGREWDLARKQGGLYILPPMSEGGNGSYTSRVVAFQGIVGMINYTKAEYVLVADSNLVYNMDYSDLIDAHETSGADITMLYHKADIHTANHTTPHLALHLGGERVDRITIAREGDTQINKYLNVFVIKKTLLLSLINKAISENITDFERGILMNLPTYSNVHGYEYSDYTAEIDSLLTYFNASMDLLQMENRSQIFKANNPICTKVHDEVPATYGLNSKVNNSLIADGAIIDGEVENSLIFRGVKIGKGAKVKNCILMQGSVIGDGAQLEYVVADKGVSIGKDRMIMGYGSYPVFVKKGSIV